MPSSLHHCLPPFRACQCPPQSFTGSPGLLPKLDIPGIKTSALGTQSSQGSHLLWQRRGRCSSRAQPPKFTHHSLSCPCWKLLCCRYIQGQGRYRAGASPQEAGPSFCKGSQTTHLLLAARRAGDLVQSVYTGLGGSAWDPPVLSTQH